MNKSALERFFLNQCSDVEKTEVENWMRDPMNDAELQVWMKEHWDSLAASSAVTKPDAGKIWQNLQHQISNNNVPQEDESEASTPVVPLFRKKKIRYFSAAAILLIMVCSYFGYQYFNHASINNNLAAYGNHIETQKNNTSTETTVLLEDGTMVKLKPNASISYPQHFSNDKREVSLQGNAFFEVAKNAAKPFLVYTNNVVTKVLGTSFTINTDSGSNNISVAVHTGRVQVFEKNKANEKQLNTKSLTTNGVIITANQQTVYSQELNSFKTTLVAVPLPVPGKQIENGYFDFNREPLAVVLSKIEKIYGVEIVPENENLNKCIFSGELDDASLFEKLDILCVAINATYEVAGTKVLLKGKGCK